ncbi:MAG: hypothetical protein E3J72_00345 [Planctomycetota bacterium]|nr:MAG: hypothetical protein E3J72_00345 [Planctomycetota bacterium]
MRSKAMVFTLVICALALFSCSTSKSDRSGSGGGGGSGTGTGNGTGSGTGTGTGTTPTGTGSAKVVIDFDWALKPNVDTAELEAKANQIKEINKGLYKATEGQICLGAGQTLEDGKSTGDIIICEVISSGMGITGSPMTCGRMEVGMGKRGYYLIICNRAPPTVFLHEFCHGEFRRYYSEEYDCRICAMGVYTVGGSEILHYCDDSDCQAASNYKPCWDTYILAQYPSFTHTGADPGNAPECQVTVSDK